MQPKQPKQHSDVRGHKTPPTPFPLQLKHSVFTSFIRTVLSRFFLIASAKQKVLVPNMEDSDNNVEVRH